MNAEEFKYKVTFVSPSFEQGTITENSIELCVCVCERGVEAE